MAAKGSENLGNAGTGGPQSGWLAAGGLAGAALASACCVVPLLLVTLGATGAWIGKLTALEPYNPIFSAIALICIGVGFWRVYFRRERDCGEGGICVTGRSGAITKAILWVAALVTVTALTTSWWAPLFY
jgi:mercuric ion transport protein